MPTDPTVLTEEHAMQYALRLLSYRMRSVAEMETRLARKAYPPAIITPTIAKLQRLGLLDDADFARTWVESRCQSRGPTRLKQELRQKGIARDLAEKITATVPVEEEFAAAWRIATRTIHGDTAPDRPTVSRLWQLLLRRGFSSEVIRRVCAQLAHPLSGEGNWLDE